MSKKSTCYSKRIINFFVYYFNYLSDAEIMILFHQNQPKHIHVSHKQYRLYVYMKDANLEQFQLPSQQFHTHQKEECARVFQGKIHLRDSAQRGYIYRGNIPTGFSQIKNIKSMMLDQNLQLLSMVQEYRPENINNFIKSRQTQIPSIKLSIGHSQLQATPILNGQKKIQEQFDFLQQSFVKQIIFPSILYGNNKGPVTFGLRKVLKSQRTIISSYSPGGNRMHKLYYQSNKEYSIFHQKYKISKLFVPFLNLHPIQCSKNIQITIRHKNLLSKPFSIPISLFFEIDLIIPPYIGIFRCIIIISTQYFCQMHPLTRVISTKFSQISKQDLQIQNCQSSYQKSSDFDENYSERISNRIYPQNTIRQSEYSVWSQADFKMLVDLYKKYGSKWKRISSFYSQKTANTIKNHFYSRLRKAIRLLNKLVKTYYKLSYKTFNLNIIFKLTNLIDQKIAKKQYVSPQVIEYYAQFVYRFISFSQLTINLSDIRQSQCLEIQSLILSFTALQNLWLFLGNIKKIKIKKRIMKLNKNIKLKLNKQTENYLFLTEQKCFISQQYQGDLALFRQVQSQVYFQNSQKQKYYKTTTSEPGNQKQSKSTVRPPFLKLQRFLDESAQIFECQQLQNYRPSYKHIQMLQVNQEAYTFGQRDLFDQKIQSVESQSILF